MCRLCYCFYMRDVVCYTPWQWVSNSIKWLVFGNNWLASFIILTQTLTSCKVVLNILRPVKDFDITRTVKNKAGLIIRMRSEFKSLFYGGPFYFTALFGSLPECKIMAAGIVRLVIAYSKHYECSFPISCQSKNGLIFVDMTSKRYQTQAELEWCGIWAWIKELN